MNTKLIASAPTIERLIDCAVKYWCGSNIRIEGEKVFNNNGQIKDVVVINKKVDLELKGCKMTNKDKATARPWENTGFISEKNKTIAIKDKEGQLVAIVWNVNAEENAKLIVKAVNMHDELVSAVNDAFCLIGEALIDECPTEEERELWQTLQDKLGQLLLRSEA